MILDGKFFLVLVCLQMSPPSIWGAKKLKCKNPKVNFYIDYKFPIKLPTTRVMLVSISTAAVRRRPV